MQKLAYAFAVATGVALFAAHAVAQNAAAPASPGGAADASACATSSEATGGGSNTISASGGSGSAVQNLKVYSCNGIRLGTAISTTTGPNGTTLTVSPDANFLNGVSSFQISAKGATMGEGQITLVMTDRDVRTTLASEASGAAAAK